MGKHLFGAVYAAEGTAPAALEALVREFSPRFELHGSRDVTFDLNGLTRLFGDGRAIADVLRHTGARRGLRLRVAIAGTRTAARLLAHATAGVTVIDPGTETAAVAALSLELLAAVAPLDLATLRNGGCERAGISPAFPLAISPLAWVRTASAGSAWHVVKISARCCLSCRRNISNSHSISTGRLRDSSP